MKIKCNINEKDNQNKQKMLEYIRDFVQYNNEVVIVNIGTDRSIGDSLAPMVGTILIQNNCPLKVYGTLQNPIHALNLKENIDKIKNKHPNAKIIAIDACLGEEKEIGSILVRDYPINPGKGVGKTLPQVGDISIVGIVEKEDTPIWLENKNIRLGFIYEMANTINEIIIHSYTENKSIMSKTYNFINKNNKKYYREVAIN